MRQLYRDHEESMPTSPPGTAYMTLYLRAASAYQNSNWWANFVERNRQAVLTETLTGTVANIPVSQAKTSAGITLQKNRSQVDLGSLGLLWIICRRPLAT